VRRLGIVLAVVLAACGAALALGATSEDGAKGTTYEIVFDNAFGLTEGGDFKIAGVRAGQTKSFRVEGQQRPLAVVEAEVTEPGFADLREDARCEIRPQSLIGEYFVDCQPGASERKLPDGGRVPVDQTSSTIPADLVNSILRRPYRERLRLIVGELGAGLAGRPEDLSQALRRAHPGLRETSETLRVLGRQTDTIERFIVDADRVIAELEARKEDVSRFVREAGNTAEISASRRAALADSFRRLPAFLTELEPYMGRLGDLAQAQQPVLRDL
jgi:virulence factor Mce-like protein